MANAFVEKMKAFGLNHGEKVGMGICGVLGVGLAVLGLSKEPITLDAKAIESAANQASQNLGKDQPLESIKEKVEGAEFQVVKHDFLAKAANQEGNKLVAANYKNDQPWVRLEPGAGILREMPRLLAPDTLRASGGRGGALLFALNDQGKRVTIKLSDDEKKEEEKKPKRRRGNNLAGGGSSSMPGAMGGAMAGDGAASGSFAALKKRNSAEDRAEKERQALEAQKKAERFGGGKTAKFVDPTKKAEVPTKSEDEELADPDAPPPGEKFKEELVGRRWVVVTGILDQEQMRDNYVDALKIPKTDAYPNYKQLKVERQRRLDDGSWSDWEEVSYAENQKTTYNLVESDADFSPPEVRLLGKLVDPLPYLRVGTWVGSEPGELVPDDKKETPKNNQIGMGGGMMAMYGGMMPGMMGGADAGMPGAMGGSGGGDDSSMMMMRGGGMPGMMSGSGSGGMAMMGGSGGGAGGAPEAERYDPAVKTDATKVMVRYLDYTAQPETTYRYRLAVVVYNPNYGRTSVMPGVDVASEELVGPWSDPTEPVTVPASIASHVLAMAPTDKTHDDRLKFQLARWNGADGTTVVQNVEVGPGEFIGKPAKVQVADYSGDTIELKSGRDVDFSTFKLVVDSLGGAQTISNDLGVGGTTSMEMPPVSLLLKPDGRLVVRQSSFDAVDESMIESKKAFRRELQEAGKDDKKKSREGFGGMDAMMGSGMGGRGGMGGAMGRGS